MQTLVILVIADWEETLQTQSNRAWCKEQTDFNVTILLNVVYVSSTYSFNIPWRFIKFNLLNVYNGVFRCLNIFITDLNVLFTINVPLRLL